MKNRYRIEGSSAYILLYYKGSWIETAIDVADLPRVQEWPHTWSVGQIKGRWRVYAMQYLGNGKSRPLYLSRWLLDAPPDLVVDHIDHNPLNNRRSNLRAISVAANNQNLTNRQGKLRNVSWDKIAQRWVVQLTVQGRHIVIGRFDSLEEAENVASASRKALMPYS